MMTPQLLAGVVLIAGGFYLALKREYLKDTPVVRGFGRAMRTFGIVAACSGALDLFARIDNSVIELSSHGRYLLRYYSGDLGGAALGIIITLVVSGYMSAYFGEWKKRKKQRGIVK